MTIYYFIYILNDISYKEAAYNKDFIINLRDDIAKKYRVDPETMPIFEEK